MRLWHQDLIERLPRAQLLGQHRECCALRGNGWQKKHSIVDYVFTYDYYYLFLYHKLVMVEMEKRSYRIDILWKDPYYRGKKCPPYLELNSIQSRDPIYPEHNQEYLEECLKNLEQKGISLEG